jgi:hypothetical protein
LLCLIHASSHRIPIGCTIEKTAIFENIGNPLKELKLLLLKTLNILALATWLVLVATFLLEYI